MKNSILLMPAIPLITQVLERLYHSGFTLGIVTSNTSENVLSWLEMQNLDHFFHFIRAESKLFSKNYALKKIMKSYKIEKTKVVYIGDETRDIDAANQSGIRSVAVTWGYNSEKVMLESNPTFVARKPFDILTICGIEPE